MSVSYACFPDEVCLPARIDRFDGSILPRTRTLVTRIEKDGWEADQQKPEQQAII